MKDSEKRINHLELNFWTKGDGLFHQGGKNLITGFKEKGKIGCTSSKIITNYRISSNN